MVRSDLPLLVIGQAAMRQGGLAPARVEEADAIVLVSHVCSGGFNGASVGLREQRYLLALVFDNLV
jgi:hypothetical protein